MNIRTMGTISPCTSRIQFEEKPSPGYARKVTLLIRVARMDMPIAQEGNFPFALKYVLVLFCRLENRRPMASDTRKVRMMIR